MILSAIESLHASRVRYSAEVLSQPHVVFIGRQFATSRRRWTSMTLAVESTFDPSEQRRICWGSSGCGPVGGGNPRPDPSVKAKPPPPFLTGPIRRGSPRIGKVANWVPATVLKEYCAAQEPRPEWRGQGEALAEFRCPRARAMNLSPPAAELCAH
jgi:hypothetical protein